MIAVSFGCPFEGRVGPDPVLSLARRLVESGAREIGFGDATGVANPQQVRAFFEQAQEALPRVELTAHFHNARGQGLANALAALEVGIESFASASVNSEGARSPPARPGTSRPRTWSR